MEVLLVSAADGSKYACRLRSELLEMAVVRVTAVLMAWYQSLIMRSLASGVCVMSRVAWATVARRQMPMAAMTSIRASTTPKPMLRRARVLRLFMACLFLTF